MSSWSSLFIVLLGALRIFFRSQSDAALEILALRQQVAVLKRHRRRPPLNSGDRSFWTTLRRLRPRWAEVKPETVVGRHYAGFRLYWRWQSRSRGGRPRITQEVKDLIGRLAQENHEWGAPEIHAELQTLGFSLAERTVARYLRCVVRHGDPDQKWHAFLENNSEVIAAFDFFTVSTVTFRMLN